VIELWLSTAEELPMMAVSGDPSIASG